MGEANYSDSEYDWGAPGGHDYRNDTSEYYKRIISYCIMMFNVDRSTTV